MCTLDTTSKLLLCGITLAWLILLASKTSAFKIPRDGVGGGGGDFDLRSSLRRKSLESSRLLSSVDPSPPTRGPDIREGNDGKSSRFEATINTSGLFVWLQEKQIYSAINNTVVREGKVSRYHGGIHVIVLHERWHRVMRIVQFHTWQPASHRMLTKAMQEIQDGRIVIFLGVPEYTTWLTPDAAQMLADMRSRFGPMSAQGEAWVMAVRKGHEVIFESIITSRNVTAYDVSPLICSATIPVFPERACAWHGIPEMRERALFCDRYEGYGDFCRCENPSTINPRNAPRLRRHYETIPIALVTATRVPNALRQILHIWSNQGGAVTPITLMVDGYNAEAEHLAKVLNVSALFHNNRAKKGTKHRINEHVKFSLESIFRQYPDVNRAIILEDDLTLSPDFVSYFQQTAILMRFDPTILCVNAYNYNAYPHTAYDPTRIYRVQSYPYYGWMTDRVHAKKLLGNWAPLDAEADWDLWVRKHHVDIKHQVIIPEVPRTKHEGGGGVHVTGYEQELSFHQRPYNLRPNVTLNMIRLWDFAYALDIMRILDKATTVNITQHPCDKHPVPRYQKRPHAIYVNISGEDDPTNSYKTITRCLGFYSQLLENYQGTVMMKFFETPVIIVACPPSPYCVDVPKSAIYSPTQSDYDHALKHGWRRTNMTAEVMVRVPASDVVEEFNLENTDGYDFGLRD